MSTSGAFELGPGIFQMIGGIGAPDDVGGKPRSPRTAQTPRRRSGQHPAEIPDHCFDHHSLPMVCARSGAANTEWPIGTSLNLRLAWPVANGYFCRMKFSIPAIAGLLMVASPAYASSAAVLRPRTHARSVVTIVGSRGNFCTGRRDRAKAVLTAAHCVQPGADYKIVEYGATGSRNCRDVQNVAVHPAFNMQAMLAHRATADVALLQLADPPRGKIAVRRGAPTIPIIVGGHFTIACIGWPCAAMARVGRHHPRRGIRRDREAGNAADPPRRSGRAGFYAMGWAPAPAFRRPVFEDKPAGPAIIAYISWSTGPNGSAGCGGITGVTPLTLYRDWILQTAWQWGAGCNRFGAVGGKGALCAVPTVLV